MTRPSRRRRRAPHVGEAVQTAPVLYFRCRICGSAAVLAHDDGQVIRCTTCGFSEPVVTRA